MPVLGSDTAAILSFLKETKTEGRSILRPRFVEYAEHARGAASLQTGCVGRRLKLR
jgi:hypothetical protein